MNHFILLVAVDLEISWDGTEESDDVRLSKENKINVSFFMKIIAFEDRYLWRRMAFTVNLF